MPSTRARAAGRHACSRVARWGGSWLRRATRARGGGADRPRSLPAGVCLPLVAASGRAVGVLALGYTSGPRQPDPDDLNTLRLLADQLAALVDSMQLQQRLQRSLDALLALHEA